MFPLPHYRLHLYQSYLQQKFLIYWFWQFVGFCKKVFFPEIYLGKFVREKWDWKYFLIDKIDKYNIHIYIPYLLYHD